MMRVVAVSLASVSSFTMSMNCSVFTSGQCSFARLTPMRPANSWKYLSAMGDSSFVRLLTKVKTPFRMLLR